jgi:hypothetical protein
MVIDQFIERDCSYDYKGRTVPSALISMIEINERLCSKYSIGLQRFSIITFKERKFYPIDKYNGIIIIYFIILVFGLEQEDKVFDKCILEMVII